jgi:hypothetical protein
LFEMVAGMLDITQGIRNILGYPIGGIFEDKSALTIALD